SEGAYASLNLGTKGDDPAHVAENRRRACEALGLDAARLAVNRQRHSPTVHRAEPGVQDEPGDGLWTEAPNVPLLALGADWRPSAHWGARAWRAWSASTSARAATPSSSSRTVATGGGAGCRE